MGTDSGAIAAAQALSLLFSATFLSYWVFILVCYLRRTGTVAGDPSTLQWHLFVPCLDESAVIGDTVRYLRATFPSVHVWVIDDDSEDATAAIVAAIGQHDDRIHLVRRRRPDARVGKGAALNAAYLQLRDFLGDTADPTQVIVGVVDADGRPSTNSLAMCAGASMFGDPMVGGIQVEVRIVNRDDPRPLVERGPLVNLMSRTLIRMQDVEFRTVIGAVQTSRAVTRTVGMGGNGQYTRLSALESLDCGDGRAWRGSLLEDYELGVHLMLAGHRTAFTADAWVDQEGLPSLSRYLTQRTRWGQGVMQCMRYLPKAWNSPNLTTLGAIETSYYLFQPWLSLLGTVVFPIPIVAMIVAQTRSGTTLPVFLAHGGWALVVMYLLLGTTPFWLWGPIYRRRCEPDAGLLTSFGWGLAYLLYIYGFYITSWRAAVRIARGHNGWSKTRRNAEFVGAPATFAVGPAAFAVADPCQARPVSPASRPGPRVRPACRFVGHVAPTPLRPDPGIGLGLGLGRTVRTHGAVRMLVVCSRTARAPPPGPLTLTSASPVPCQRRGADEYAPVPTVRDCTGGVVHYGCRRRSRTAYELGLLR